MEGMSPNGRVPPGTVPPPSPWVVPPSRAPKKSRAIALVLIGFGILIGGMFFDLYGIFHGMDMSVVFPVFILCLVLGPIVLIVGAVMFAKSVASEKYAQVARMRQEYMARDRQCPNCGRTIPADSRMCPYCGTRFM